MTNDKIPEFRGVSSTRQGLLTAEEVSRQLRLSLSTVYYLAKTGALRAFQVGRSWRFPAEEIGRLTAGDNGPVRVLVVDDDEVTRTWISEALRPRGCHVEEAGTLAGALATAQRQRFDCLLVDLQLPDGNGAELIRKLLGDYRLGQVAVITAFPNLAHASELLELGALTVLRKPLSTSQLVDCVERIVGKPLPEAVQHAGQEAVGPLK